MGITLALETSAKAASVALCDGETLLAQYFQNSGLTHSRTILQMTEDILRNNDVALRDVERIAAARGPGSFTGIRIGVAAAQGLAWGASLKVCGVSTLRAMSSVFRDETAILCPVMDARRSEVYNAKFVCGDGGPRRLCGDRALSLEALVSEAKNDDAPYLLFGDGAVMCYEYFTAQGVPARLAPEVLRWQTAYGVALAALGVPPVPPESLEPNYLRVSQAERLRAQPTGE
ncbi:MAG: tRNA (adenosine(37)-N6)-threonylcarbamoyltransferase complex dimerization subunit type 1 TsaB [Oscillospiraceae bacterium]|jgi:tRNA threonylcarbamoyladenosine biosynthesis protein TsaB|nr:tRNA (adenosine(37)-N6)-threonylcarbamoyltransferase complex dimerization subunit type 1 TsaB [Oscillospiraceae bacterium]